MINATAPEEGRGVGGKSVRGGIERDKKSGWRIQIFHRRSRREVRNRPAKKSGGILLQRGLNFFPQLFVFWRFVQEISAFRSDPRDLAARETRGQSERRIDDEDPRRSRYGAPPLASTNDMKIDSCGSPSIQPSEDCFLVAVVRDGHSRKQNGIIAKRSEDYLIDRILLPFYGFPEIALAHDSVEGFAVSGIIGAEYLLSIGEEADATAEVGLFRKIIVQKFRRTFVLANLHVSEVRNCRNDAIVADLVRVVGGTAPLLVHGRNRFRIGYLIAGVAISGQAKLIGNPLAKMA